MNVREKKHLFWLTFYHDKGGNGGCLEVWPCGNRCGLGEGSLSLWAWALRPSS
ncbi:hypothetical protein T4D_10082 [Trichinella pseudospiralis]|uniref:Uncharacterized protein n=1 Tax=Trichinella pseudospiralis TaxID=6337 RepID=A0A0V1DND2_TRIPS|nr:hypothetical protein T4D_10082 [Trichinella pseudospiralis]